MPKPTATSRKQAPLATIQRPVKAKIYRGRLRPFASAKYLDMAALRRAPKATIELGTVEVPGVGFTLAAEIRRGMITRLTPLPCVGCKRRRAGKAKLKRILAAVRPRIEALERTPRRLPIRL